MAKTIDLQQSIMEKYKVKVPVSIKICKDKNVCPECVKGKVQYKKHCTFPKQWKNAASDLTDGSEKNVGILTGEINDLFVIDIDSAAAKQYFISNIGDFEKGDLGCQVVKTYKGYHLYFKYPTGFDVSALYKKSSTNVLKKYVNGIDIRADGGIIFFGSNYVCTKFTDSPGPVPHDFLTLLERNVEVVHQNNLTEYQENYNGKHVRVFEKNKIDEIRIVLKTLSTDRYENFSDWVKVGLILKNDLGAEGLELFNMFSKQSRKHNLSDEELKEWYDSFCPTDCHIGSLMYMWKVDNPGAPIPKIKKEKAETAAATVDDDTAAKTLCELAGDKLIYCTTEKCFYVFDEKTGLWDSSEKALKLLINKFKQQMNLGEKNNYGGMFNKYKAMIPFLTNYTKCFDGFIEKNIDKSLRKILFKNGIFDMTTGKFVSGFDQNIVFLDRIDRDYRDMNALDPKLVHKINKIVFEDPFSEHITANANFLKQAIAIGISGDYILKKGLWAVGPTNTAKGLITSVLISSFGSYIGCYNQNSLLFNKNTADEAKKLSWIFEINNKRIIIGNEVKKSKDAKIDSNLVKSIISGGDNLQVRKNFKDEENKKNRAFIMNFLNDLLPFEPWDDAIDDRMLFLQFTRVFVDNPEDEELEDAFVTIIFNAYREYLNTGFVYPQVLKDLKKEWVQDESPLQKAFDSTYVITGNQNDYVIVKDMVKALQPQSEFTKKKLEMELNKIIKTSKKIVDGCDTRVKRGVKPLEEAEANDEDVEEDII